MGRKDKDNSQSGYTLNILKDVKDLESIHDMWVTLHSEASVPNPNTDYCHYNLVLNNLNSLVRPHVIIVKKNENPTAMVVGRIETKKIDYSIGYMTLFSTELRCLTIAYGGVFGNFDTQTYVLIVRSLLESLKRSEAEAVFINSLEVDSHSYMFQILKEMPSLFCRDFVSSSSTHWKMRIPNSLDQFLSSRSKKHRSNLRSYSRKIKKDYPGKIRIKCFRDLNDVPLLLDDVESIAKRTYQRGLSVGFKKSPLEEARMIGFAQRGWLRAYVLYVDNTPCAYQLGFLYRNRYYVSGKGYDPSFRRYRAGTFLFLNMLEEFCKDKKINEWDFGIGDAEYKEHYGNEYWLESSVLIFAPTIRGFTLNAIRTLTNLTSIYGGKLIARLGTYNLIRSKWRHRLIPRNDIQ